MRALIIVIALLVSWTHARACSLVSGAFIRSNFELIETSDAIVIGRAIRSERHGSDPDAIIFEVEEILKGEPPSEVADEFGVFGKPTPSEPNSITRANAEAFMGSCNRRVYKRGDKYVLMLRNEAGRRFVVSGDAFSRINEDDFGPNSFWRRSIIRYISIQRNPDRMAQIDELRAIIQVGMSSNASEFDRELGKDALYHLQNIHPDKPTEWLLNMYNDPEFSMRQLRDRVAGTEEEEADELATLVFGDPSPPEDVRTTILRALSEGDHPKAEPLFRTIIAEATPEPTRLGAALAFLIRREEYNRVKQIYGEHVMWITAVAGPGSGPGFWSVVGEAVGYGDYLKVEKPFADWWRRQTFAACIIRSGPFHCSFDWEAGATLLDEPRKNTTLLLASARSPKIISWAESELDRLAAEGVETIKDDWDFPLKILLAAYRGDTPRRVHELACGSKEMREAIAGLIGDVPTIYTEQLLREMMAMNQHAHVQRQLFKSGVKIAADDMRESPLFGNADFVFEYARSDGRLELEKDAERHLRCRQ